MKKALEAKGGVLKIVVGYLGEVSPIITRIGKNGFAFPEVVELCL